MSSGPLIIVRITYLCQGPIEHCEAVGSEGRSAWLRVYEGRIRERSVPLPLRSSEDFSIVPSRRLW